MSAIEILGLVAAVFTTVSFLPQVIRTVKTKSTRDISLGMFFTLCMGLVLWLIYGIFQKDLAIIVANSCTLFLALIILVYKFRYG